MRLAIPATLEDPKAAVTNEPVIFAELLSWGARTAIGEPLQLASSWLLMMLLVTRSEIYEDRRATFIKEEIIDLARELDNKQAGCVLEPLNINLTANAEWQDPSGPQLASGSGSSG